MVLDIFETFILFNYPGVLLKQVNLMHKKINYQRFFYCLNYGTICESSIDNQEKNKHKPPII